MILCARTGGLWRGGREGLGGKEGRRSTSLAFNLAFTRQIYAAYQPTSPAALKLPLLNLPLSFPRV